MTGQGGARKGPMRIGTRGSQLARTQAEGVALRLARAAGVETELVIVRTEGDRRPDLSLERPPEPGLFTAALDEALLEGEVDLAVHSLKDLPSRIRSDLAIAAIPQREDAADALILPQGKEGSLLDLPEGALVGTSSPRRRALCLSYRPDLRVEPIRGNVDTRLAKVDAGEYDAAVMAVAGLRRMNLAHRISGALEAREWPPAPGQGALALVARRDDPALGSAVRGGLAQLESPSTRASAEAERAMLRELGAGCSLPIAGIGLPYQNRLRLWGMVLSGDGRRVIRTDRTGDQAAARELGRSVARTLQDRGAKELLEGDGGVSDATGPQARGTGQGGESVKGGGS